MVASNPAARLLDIAEKVNDLHGDLACRAGWHKVLGVESNDLSLLMSRLGKAMLLPEQAMDLIREYHPNLEQAQKHWLDRTNKMFSHNGLSGKWQSVSQHVDAHAIAGLEMASALLSSTCQQEPVSDEKLGEMRLKLNEASLALEESDLSVESKATLRKHIKNLTNAIDEFELTGREGIEEKTYQAIGDIAVNQKLAEEAKTSQAGNAFRSAIFFILTVVTTANEAAQLADNVTKLLSYPGEEVEQQVETVIDSDDDLVRA